nr:uncharacterized protein LOC109160423 [Ipomoea trifida]
MISVGERDGRKGLSVGREMEELELEEGEACYYDNNNGCDDDSIIDPDIALSYIDDKLQDVLGHFQKDFEGGVSAENLGSKFGGYGSFLPTYQRSPAIDLRNPPEVHNNNRPRSPNTTHFEGGRQNSLVSSRSSVTSTNSLLVPATRVATANPEINICIPPTRVEESTSICKTLKKPADPPDQKSLKVRIRVGSENLSTTTNAELYSGLGLDVSPSSSLDNSPSDSEGLSHDLQDAPDESPTSILQIMTSFPMHGSLLLSPLSDDLIHLMEKDWPFGKSGSKPVHKTSSETSDSTRGSRKVLSEKKRKSYEKDVIGNGYSIDMQNYVGVPSKEIDVNTLACEELVSKALKLPLLSNSFSDVPYPASQSKSIDNLATNIQGMVKEESFEHTAKEDLELVSATENDGMEKSNGIISSSGGVLESEKTNHFDCGVGFPRKEGNKSREQSDVSANTEHNKGRKTHNIDASGVSKPSIGPKFTSKNEAGVRLAKEQVSSGGKKKHKGTQIHGAHGGKVLNDGLVTDSSLGHKIKKSSSRDTNTSRSDSKGFKNHFKARDAYAELFGNLEAEEEDDKIGSEKTHSLELLKDSDAIYENNKVECNDTMKVRSNASKVEKPCALTEHPRFGSNMKTVTGTELNPSHAPIAEGPVLKEDWVMCDKCQTWRLLPLGTDPRSLPKKWLCKMLHWLPGMNRCGISEEETTKALRALYQFPTSAIAVSASETRTNNQHQYPDRKLLGVASVDAFHPGLENRTLGIQVADASGKKKYGSKDPTDESKQAGLVQSSSKINNFQETSNNIGLNDSIQSPSGDNGHKKYSRQSSTSIKEKQRNKLKERKKLLGSISSDGGAKNAKMKNKPETNLDNSRASKKVKRDGLYHDDEHWTFDTAGENAGHSSSNGMAPIASMKDRHKYKFKDSKTSDKSPLIHNPVSSSDGSLHAGKCNSKDSSKRRRKGNGYHHSEANSRSFPGLGCNSQDSVGLLEETCENGQRKEKRARVSKSEVKDSSGNNANEGKDERVRNKDQQIGQYLDCTQSQQTIDAMDSSKRHLGTLQPSMAATSSSSKVSGSQRNKSNLQELRASPVESVSSSPLRISTVDKFTSTRRNDCQDAGLLSMLTPRRSSDGENDGGSDQSGMIKKGETLNAGHNGSLDCQEADLGHISCVKVSRGTAPSPVIAKHDENVAVEPLPQCDQYDSKTQNLERGQDKGRRNDGLHGNSGIVVKKSGKGSSSKPKDKNRSYRSDFDRSTVNEPLDQMPSSGEKLKPGQNKFHERTVNHLDSNSVKDPTERLLNESTKDEIHSKLSHNNGRDVRIGIISGLDKGQALLPNQDDGRLTKKPVSDKTNGVLTSGRGKSLLPLPARSQNETAACLQSIPGSQKEATNLSVDDFEDNASRDKHGKKGQSQSRDQPSTRHSTAMLTKVRDLDAPSPVRKDSSNQAASNAVKEATNLKHMADRLKNSGSSDSTGLYFEAALKFLTGAALFESCNNDSAKHNEMTQSGQIYSSTAKLCEFCAHEFERSKDMAAAALAYKCMEVAYMRVIYSSHSNANRYRNELQAALQIFPPGESPSSSASDVDNLNNPSAVDKGGLAKGVGSPQVTGAHVMTTRNRSNFSRLLIFAQEVSFAMEASRRSRAAFAAANSKTGDDKCKEGILSVKRALDFNFQDVEGLLRLVRIAMDKIKPVKC